MFLLPNAANLNDEPWIRIPDIVRSNGFAGDGSGGFSLVSRSRWPRSARSRYWGLPPRSRRCAHLQHSPPDGSQNRRDLRQNVAHPPVTPSDLVGEIGHSGVGRYEPPREFGGWASAGHRENARTASAASTECGSSGRTVGPSSSGHDGPKSSLARSTNATRANCSLTVPGRDQPNADERTPFSLL